jgi:shikimate kinase
MIKHAHIFLCGFMGSGKSTHGKKLATLLKRKFFDLDSYIQLKENKTISFIFENEGESVFREMEKKHLKELVASEENLVISLGGGTVCFHDIIDFIKANGTLIYIDMPVKALAHRLHNSPQPRPLLKNTTGEELEKLVNEKLKEREKYYHQAHLRVDGVNINLLKIAETIKNFNA